MYLYSELSGQIIGCAIKVHEKLGPGLLESAYRKALEYELQSINLNVECEKVISIYYDGIDLGKSYKIDLIVENKIIIELKCVEKFEPVHTAQVLTYLKFSKKRLGLLLNFNTKIMKNGIKRIIL